ncbi:hypothetical protein [Tessaracoccus sp. Y1736]
MIRVAFKKVAIATAALLLTSAVAAPPASAATLLGGVSVARYCQVNVPSGNPYVASKAVNINNRWDGWRCAKINGVLVSVDMNLACRQQYPKPYWWSSNAYSGRVSDSWDAWRCYR